MLNIEDRNTYFAECYGKPTGAGCKYVQEIIDNIMTNMDPYDVYGYTFDY